jgi:opacity protein-like surface antigen
MKKTAFFFPLALACLLPAYAGDAVMPEERVLELTLPLGFNIAGQAWNGGGKWENVSGFLTLSTGLTVEYGVSSWLSAFARWTPGVNMVSRMEGETGGLFNDVVLGLRGGILGPGAPLTALQRKDMRLAAALRFKAPLPSRDGSAGETDLHLWGTGLEVSYDYIFLPQFYVNAAAEFFYYPRQWANNPVLGGKGRIDLPLELKFELEPRGVFTLGSGFITLSAGLPVTYRMFTESKIDGVSLKNDRHRFSIGASFGAAFMTKIPFALKLFYAAPIAGKNDFASHDITLSGTLYLPIR